MTQSQTFPEASLAVIGGSGFYQMPGLESLEAWRPETPFGATSDEIVIGSLTGAEGERRVAFLPRHGRGHVLLPHEIPVRANIWALKALGVEGIIAVSAVGSLREEIARGDLATPDQIIDRTKGDRVRSFFEGGIAAHVGFADPFCADLSGRLADAGERLGKRVHRGGAYVCMEGPAFSTRAESALHRSWGASIVGMTAIPEAKLAREAEIAYAMLATATDYDVWREDEEDVTAEAVAAVVAANVESAQAIVAAVARGLPAGWRSTAAGALRGAIMTDAARIPAAVRERYALLIEGYVS